MKINCSEAAKYGSISVGCMRQRLFFSQNMLVHIESTLLSKQMPLGTSTIQAMSDVKVAKIHGAW